MDSLKQLDAAEAAGHLSQAASSNIRLWLTEPKYADYVLQVEELLQQSAWQELEDRFFKVVPFGTGGRRGTVGVGSNRINRVTIGESAQGLANYLLAHGEETKSAGVAIGFDTRLTSVEFSQLTAQIFAANGFRVYLFDGFRATPELSFAVRHLKTAAGVVISASHNPPSDNGFKAYWSDGGQIVAPHDSKIMEHVASVTDVKLTDYDAAVSDGKIILIGAEIDKAYTAAVVAQSILPTRSARIAYSPLHGTGSTSVIPVLQAAGFADVTVVAEQAMPDGNFPNIKNNVPNPEVQDTNELAKQTAQEQQADLAITTDPDADRLGVIARDSAGEYRYLNGNQIASLIGYYVISQLKLSGNLTPQHFVVKTIVTTDFLTAFAQDFGVKIYDNILIGFKYVAELIKLNEGRETFLFGGEESHGILKGDYTRDKDAAVAALLMCELASFLKDQGRDLLWQLDELYKQYGVFHESLENIAYKGAEGSATMARLMAGLRANPPQELFGKPLLKSIDRLDPGTPGTPGDVLIYHVSADSRTRLTVRPSGTEPKLKIYAQIHRPAPTTEQLQQVKDEAKTEADQLIAALKNYCDQLLATSAT